jgi:DNA-binding LytR/AlgR family response regulator
MKSLNILIVEDEILIAETIKIYLEERGHHVFDIAISYEEATNAFHLRKPDLVLLDIRLYGEKSGIDFANFLTNQIETVPFIYLTSQYDQRILDHALKTNPYGYLTKPIHKISLWTSIESAYNLYFSKKSTEKIIFMQDGKNNYHIKVSDILYIKADHVYSKITTLHNQEIIVRKSLQQVYENLNIEYMIYCHRSYIINCKYITSWNQDTIALKNDIIVPISRSKRKDVLATLEQIK